MTAAAGVTRPNVFTAPPGLLRRPQARLPQDPAPDRVELSAAGPEPPEPPGGGASLRRVGAFAAVAAAAAGAFGAAAGPALIATPRSMVPAAEAPAQFREIPRREAPFAPFRAPRAGAQVISSPTPQARPGRGTPTVSAPSPQARPASSSVAFQNLEKTPLRQGMEGPAVARFQKWLNHAQPVAATGRFDDATEAAVRRYQARHGLASDGVVGNGTFGMLFEELFWKGGLRPSMTDPAENAALPRDLEVVVDLGRQRAFLVDGQSREALRSYPISSGAPGFATPQGNFRITAHYMKPEWVPPSSDWARGSSLVPPGPDNPLGPAAMQLSGSTVLLHGVPHAKFGSLGRSPQSHGCVRMYPHHVMELYELLPDGATVRVVPDWKG